MSHFVVAQPELRVPTERSPGLELYDETAGALQASELAVISAAIIPAGPAAVFNRLQVPQLLAEFRAIAANENRAVQGNLNDIVNHIEERLSTRDDAFVYFMPR